MALIASSTSTGVLDMTRTTGAPSGSRRSMNAVGMPAATETTSRSPGRLRPEVVEQGTHVLRLHREDQGVGRLGGLGVVDDLYAVALGEQLGPLGAPGGDEDVGRLAPARSMPDSSASPILPAPSTATRSMGAWVAIAYPFVARARRKKTRLAGRSAIRRTR